MLYGLYSISFSHALSELICPTHISIRKVPLKPLQSLRRLSCLDKSTLSYSTGFVMLSEQSQWSRRRTWEWRGLGRPQTWSVTSSRYRKRSHPFTKLETSPNHIRHDMQGSVGLASDSAISYRTWYEGKKSDTAPCRKSCELLCSYSILACCSPGFELILDLVRYVAYCIFDW